MINIEEKNIYYIETSGIKGYGLFYICISILIFVNFLIYIGVIHG